MTEQDRNQQSGAFDFETMISQLKANICGRKSPSDTCHEGCIYCGICPKDRCYLYTPTEILPEPLKNFMTAFEEMI